MISSNKPVAKEIITRLLTSTKIKTIEGQYKRVRPGKDDKHLGLGLYVARLIAEGHGGRIEAANTDNGVRISVTLPGDLNGE